MSALRLRILGAARFTVDDIERVCKQGNPFLLEELFALYAGNVLPWPPGEEVESVKCTRESGRGNKTIAVRIEARASDGTRYAMGCTELPDGSTVCYPLPP